MSKSKTFIDDDDEHNRVLYELGILDDDDDWELFKKQQEKILASDPDFETYAKYVNGMKDTMSEIPTMMPVEQLCESAGNWDSLTQYDVVELLKNQQARIEKLEAANRAYKETIFTNTNRKITMEDRFFIVNEDGFILDNNFDFDAGWQITGDFVDGEKYEYAQMIVAALNKVAKEDRDEEQRRIIESIEDNDSPEVKRLKDIIEEQKRSIIALNDCIGGEGSCTTDNLVRVGRLEHTIEFLKKKNEILKLALQEAIDGMGGSYAIWAPKAKAALDGEEENSKYTE